MKPERKRKKQEWARQTIVKAARELAAQGGAQALTVRQVAERAGIAPSVFYYYFENSGQLTDAVCRQAGEEAAAVAKDAIKPERSFVENFLEVWRTLLRLAWERPGEYRMLSSLTREGAAGPGLELLTRQIELEIAAGTIQSREAQPLAEDIWTAAQALICRLTLREKSLEVAEKRLNEFLSLLLRGMRAEGRRYENIGD